MTVVQTCALPIFRIFSSFINPDLPRGVESGLIKALKILKGVKGISFIHLTAMDVVRHPVVQRIIERYEGKDE